jgi:7,8-dihydroneopterin 2',3'-cyclic phosphate phosphodiesterase
METKELIELANKIQNKDLKKKVIEFLKDPSLTHPEFKKYPKTSVKKVKVYFSTPFGLALREVYTHTLALTNLCIEVAKIVKKFYNIDLNLDHLIAASLLHDIMKIYVWKVEGGEPKATGITLDHSYLAVAELYKRNFPEAVIHIIASHFGEQGPTPPKTPEAFLFHHLDSMLSLFEAHLHPVSRGSVPVLILDEKLLKELKEAKE